MEIEASGLIVTRKREVAIRSFQFRAAENLTLAFWLRHIPISLSAVSETLRRKALRDEEGMPIAGVFLIQRLEGSRFGAPMLWVLNDGAGR